MLFTEDLVTVAQELSNLKLPAVSHGVGGALGARNGGGAGEARPQEVWRELPDSATPCRS